MVQSSRGTARPLIEAEHLSVAYGGATILDHIDLVIRAGEIVTLIGPNGSGKTKLDRILRRFPKPTITFEPEEILKTLRLDKKSSQGKARFVLLEAIGCPVAFDGAYCTEIDDAAVLSALNIFLDMNIPAKL